MLPAAEKIVPVLEGIGYDKIWVNSSSLDQPLTILPDQALEIVAIAKITAYWLNHDPVGVAEVGYGPQRTSLSCTVTPAKERMRKSHARRRLGLRPVQILVSEQEIDFLLARHYQLTRTDDRSIGRAVSAFLSDLVLEGA